MPNPELERVERLAHAEKIRHWNGPKPWDGFRMPSIKVPIPVHKVKVGLRGDVEAMPLLIGRPCFGQPSAFMRHGGGKTVYNPRRKTWGLDRCGRCGAKDACEFVAKKRLRATPEIDAAYQEWESLGGRNATWNPAGAAGTVANVYGKLVRLLQTTVHFRSVNDAPVIAHYDALEQEKRNADAARKRRSRQRAVLEKAAAGKNSPEVESILEAQRVWRAAEHITARRHPDGPGRLTQTSNSTAVFDSLVWLSKTHLELRGSAVNDSAIATEMHRMGFELNRTHGGLRDGVRRALNRIGMLERTRLPGKESAIWPRFTTKDLREALADYPLQD